MSKLAQSQGVCPNCKADHDISYGVMEILDGNSVYFFTECHNCGTTWEEHYTLGFDSQEQIEKPNEQ